jgi:hypothetical protein
MYGETATATVKIGRCKPEYGASVLQGSTKKDIWGNAERNALGEWRV